MNMTKNKTFIPSRHSIRPMSFITDVEASILLLKKQKKTFYLQILVVKRKDKFQVSSDLLLVKLSSINQA
jgi:hypothetical protein